VLAFDYSLTRENCVICSLATGLKVNTLMQYMQSAEMYYT